MTKIRFYRAMNGGKYQEDFGYKITFYNGTSSVDLVFSKSLFDKWDITEFETGYLVHKHKFKTRKKAIEAITGEYLNLIIDKLCNNAFYEKARANLKMYAADHIIEYNDSCRNSGGLNYGNY